MPPGYEDFDDYKDTMIELAAKLPEGMQDNPTVEDLKDLYWKAVRHDGKMEAGRELNTPVGDSGCYMPRRLQR